MTIYSDGPLSVRTDIFDVRAPRQELGAALFGNDMGFNQCVVKLRAPIALHNYDEAPTISAVTAFGIVLSCDTADMGDTEDVGFHNHLIPWVMVEYIYQYIAT